MRFRRSTIAALGLILALPAAWADAADAPATRPAQAENQSNSPADELVSELDFKGTSLGDFVTFLADQWKDVQIVQINGPWQQFTLPHLHLRKVTRKQVMLLLNSIYPVLYIHPLEQGNDGGQPGMGGQFEGNVWIFQQLPGQTNAVQTRVSAFGLAQTVDRLAFHRMAILSSSETQTGGRAESGHSITGPDKDAEQKALKDVLSLIQATLDQSADPGISATVMLHEPTETVLVKGTQAQISAVQQALGALDNSISDQTLEGKLLQFTNENTVLRQQLESSHLREAQPGAAAKAATKDKSGSKE